MRWVRTVRIEHVSQCAAAHRDLFPHEVVMSIVAGKAYPFVELVGSFCLFIALSASGTRAKAWRPSKTRTDVLACRCLLALWQCRGGWSGNSGT